MLAYLSPKGRLYSKNNFAKDKAGTYYNYRNIAPALAGWLNIRFTIFKVIELIKDN